MKRGKKKTLNTEWKTQAKDLQDLFSFLNNTIQNSRTFEREHIKEE